MKPDLNDGLWLEDRGILLPWRVSQDQLNILAPSDLSVVRRGQTVHVWNARIWGGMQCQVTTSFDCDAQSMLQGVRITFTYPSKVRTLPEAFRWLQEKLTDRFGAPASYSDDGEYGRAVWHTDAITIRHQSFNGWDGYHEVLVFFREPLVELLQSSNNQ